MLTWQWYVGGALLILGGVGILAFVLRLARLEDHGEKHWLESDEVPGPPVRLRRLFRKLSSIIGAVIEAILQG